MNFRKFKTICPHIFFNVFLNGFDIYTDIKFAIDLFLLGHFQWGAWTLVFVFTPFLIKLCELARDSWKKGKALTGTQWFKVFLHLPLLAPFVNLFLAIRFMLLDFEKPENDSQIEAILKVSGLTSLYESFGEAGPQLVLQSHIFACTGQISTTQKVTSITSLMSLTWSASRAFFIMRDPDHADADPSLKMVLLIVLPMLWLVLSSTFCLTMAGGILKYWVALIIAAIAFLNFLVQLRKCENKKGYKEDAEQGGGDEDFELLQTLRIRDEDNGKEQSEESKK